MPGYCEPDDVRTALQERDLSGPLQQPFIEPAIESVSAWLQRRGRVHYYDSAASGTATLSTSAATATDVARTVPSGPHASDRQIHIAERGVRYPVTARGPYAKVVLPHRHVQSVDTLLVRDRDGGVEDWTAASDKVEGRGEDYYLTTDGTSSYGRSYLLIRASSIGPRTDFGELLTLDYDYGLDAADGDDWLDVRRGIAMLAGAQAIVEDDVLTAIPDNGQLIGVDTQRQQLIDDAMDLLEPHLTPSEGTR